MAAAGVASIPLCPEDRDRGAPSAPRTFEISSSLARHQLIGAGRVVQTFAPLGLPSDAYDPKSRNLVVVAVLRCNRQVVGDRGRRDPRVVDRHPLPRIP